MRHVFKKQELTHIWMAQTQEEGRSNDGKMYFRYDSIYSFGDHFPIAMVFPDKKVVLMTTRIYSSSTSKHVSIVHYSIPEDYEIIGVRYPTYTQGRHHTEETLVQDNVAAILYEMDDYWERIKSARTAGLGYLFKINDLYDNLQRYLEFCRVKHYLTYSQKKEIKHWKEYLESDQHGIDMEKWTKIADQASEKRRKQKEAQERKRLEAEREWMEEHAEKAKAIIIEWQNGNKASIPYEYRCFGTFIRLSENGEKIETSQQASVSVRAAKILYEKIIRGDNVHGFQIDNFQVIGYVNDVLTVGCHYIERKEIDRLAKKLGWTGQGEGESTAHV